MRLATAADIRRLDERAEKEFGMSRLLLMENAGASVVIAMEKVFGALDGKRVTILCGKGGNGGDGMCAARHLVAHGASVVVGLVGTAKDLRGEPLANWTILDRMGLTPKELHTEGDLAWVRAAAGASDYIVDGLVGVGARLPLAGLLGDIVKTVNAAGKPVVAIDLPSGVDPDTGRIEGGPCMIAALTVTLGVPKRGLVLHPGTTRVGKLVVADLTFPLALLTDPGVTADIVMPEEAAALIPQRSPTAHKHAVGRVLLVAGSRSMTGAALLSGAGALAGGAGMVYVAAPASAAALLHGRQPELIIRPQAETAAGGLSADALEDLLAFAKPMHAAGIGPGLGVEEATRQAVIALVERLECPVVVDADALNALVGRVEVLKKAKAPRVLTPHAGELARLMETTADVIDADRIGSAVAAATRFGATILLKGARTVVAQPGGRAFVVSTGNPGMASAGTGDVLTGLAAALLAQGLSPVAAAILGAHVHGLAGDFARDARTELSLTASDVAGAVPKAFQHLRGEGSRA
ncbi:MAG: NAD(P)H-hydrate dehydratase [Candidatus Coatesbacteria bacterium]